MEKRCYFFKTFVMFLIVFGFSGKLLATDLENHKGSYIYSMVGFMDLSHDTNDRTGTEFGNDIELGYGFTYGHNITDWIAPELQFSYSTKTGNTPSGTGREHALTVRLNGKYSFLTTQYSDFNKDRSWKIYPYAKAGGLAHALFVNAPNDDDKVGAWGYGFGLGGGLEVDYKALYLGLDLSNDLVFLQEYKKVIAGVDTTILSGGFDYQISVMAAVGVHF
ncbi:MAG: hypothetical protein A3G32_00675 [Deltaproteobacteria bacterium RIFCSPLOWO2_12_FULL_40_28]|nr:MAG: hypothetical protein A3C45_10410 [Deltaproteobacteria bacterium RIFCSPHIGHO2_02_FULL_40_28]OGQ20202.1 MAG: hypothetical protein A3E27_01195 [Deltaproteobacteria bacterium RIFCSPHIGHO2_12_FULL_40_32]OGQ40193.1 MAG: hypothetical protein A3I69_09145 [Deltaproteobacteria bacterium RIFCSPLOWO2_02_FULL_40_36]OGQ54757.1 MAG: hypothetical protein A3G32_00675 [Deltaproteobacteria bacterium RIFCSPLOWO2_12_FULL_40_28]